MGENMLKSVDKPNLLFSLDGFCFTRNSKHAISFHQY